MKRGHAILSVPVLAVLIALPISESSLAGVADALRDPASIFGQRSPGGRGAGAMFQTKPDRAASAAREVSPGPSERVLSNVHERVPPAAGGGPGVSAPSAAIAVPLETPGFVAAGPGGAGLGGAPSGGSSSGGVGAIPGGFGPELPLPGGGSFLVPVPPGNRLPIISAVPEPETWQTMILGVFAIGLALRRRGRARHAQLSGPVIAR